MLNIFFDRKEISSKHKLSDCSRVSAFNLTSWAGAIVTHRRLDLPVYDLSIVCCVAIANRHEIFADTKRLPGMFLT